MIPISCDNLGLLMSVLSISPNAFISQDISSPEFVLIVISVLIDIFSVSLFLYLVNSSKILFLKILKESLSITLRRGAFIRSLWAYPVIKESSLLA